MILSIHQPEHAVYGGFLDKMRKSDLFVILDNVQFSKNYFHNRNRVGTAEAPAWVTVPVKKHRLRTDIRDIEIAQVPWKQRYLGVLRHQYHDAPGFPALFEEVRAMIEHASIRLVDLNMAIMHWMREKLGIVTPMVWASDIALNRPARGSDLVLGICRELCASRYIAGVGGRNYLAQRDFADAGIALEFNEWHGSPLSCYDRIFRMS